MMQFTPLASVEVYRVTDNTFPDHVTWSLNQDPADHDRSFRCHTHVPASRVDANLQVHGFMEENDADMFVRGLEATDSDGRLGWEVKKVSSALYVVLIELYDSHTNGVSWEMHWRNRNSDFSCEAACS